MDGSLTRLCELFDASRELHGNLRRGLAIIGISTSYLTTRITDILH